MRLVTVTISVHEDGTVDSDIQTHNNSFSEVLKGFQGVRSEIDRVFDNMKNCPHFPKNPGDASKKIIR